MLKALLIYLLCAALGVLGMLLSGQQLSHYYSPEVLVALLLVGLGWLLTLQGEELALLVSAPRARIYRQERQQRVLMLVRQGWALLWQVVLVLILLQSVQALSRAGDAQAMTSLGVWLANVLLGGLYLMLLRLLLFLPLELVLQRQELHAADVAEWED